MSMRAKYGMSFMGSECELWKLFNMQCCFFTLKYPQWLPERYDSFHITLLWLIHLMLHCNSLFISCYIFMVDTLPPEFDIKMNPQCIISENLCLLCLLYLYTPSVASLPVLLPNTIDFVIIPFHDHSHRLVLFGWSCEKTKCLSRSQPIREDITYVTSSLIGWYLDKPNQNLSMI